MKTIIFMRHGKSSWADSGQSDHERPLKPRGVRATQMIGGQLHEHGIIPDAILSSDALRTRETCKHLLATTKWQTTPSFLPELYLAPPEQYLKLLKNLGDHHQTVLMVGHNPGLEQLVSGLSGKTLDLPTAATAVFKVDVDKWSELDEVDRWDRIHFWLPRTLED